MKCGVKFCGGCNPRYQRGDAYRAIRADFPEIDFDKVDKIRGMDIIIVTTAHTDEEARELLTFMGMPFIK